MSQEILTINFEHQFHNFWKELLRSLMMSSTLSRPTLSLTIPSVTPASALSCVGCVKCKRYHEADLFSAHGVREPGRQTGQAVTTPETGRALHQLQAGEELGGLLLGGETEGHHP